MGDQNDCLVRSALAGIFDFSRLSAMSQADLTRAFKSKGTLWAMGPSVAFPAVSQNDAMDDDTLVSSALVRIFDFRRLSAMSQADLIRAFTHEATRYEHPEGLSTSIKNPSETISLVEKSTGFIL